MATKKKVVSDSSAPEKVVKTPEPKIEKAVTDPFKEIHEMVKMVDKFYEDLESKKRAEVQQDFQHISDFNNYCEAAKHHKLSLENWRKHLEK